MTICMDVRSTRTHNILTSLAPKIIVDICERSPHSARKLRVIACKNTRENILYINRLNGKREYIVPVSTSLGPPFSAWKNKES